jgi:hypothetical protein
MKIDFKPGEPLKVTTASQLPEARLATDLEIRNAFVRRALAYDAANLITYSRMETWIVKIFRLMQQPALDDHAQITLQQAYRADKRLWALMAEETRANIIPAPGGNKPLDAALTQFADNVEVTFLLLPLQLVRGGSTSNTGGQDHSASQSSAAAHRAVPYDRPKGGNKGKGKGKDNAGKGNSKNTKGQSKSKVSPYGCAYKLSNGKPCCVFYNSTAGCKDETVRVGKRCARGFHNCGKLLSCGTVCSGDHAMQACSAV